jgi:hypothetical protein
MNDKLVLSKIEELFFEEFVYFDWFYMQPFLLIYV